jgi:hypothetical protein
MLDLLFFIGSLIAITYILYGKTVIIPIVCLLFAVLLLPMAHFFNTKLRFPHTSRVNNCNFCFHNWHTCFYSYQISDIASDFADIRKILFS